ncbi:MAG TPA: phosphoribosylglycinamide formyltransferase [Candidatus Acidoferrales bacterium]|nr:phosphoribosylglycinamide formyltransferase [Candidatus Acidoferrales bacterium]
MRSESRSPRLGLLVSGAGSNLRNLVERGFPVVAVATNRPDCGAARYARERGLEVGHFAQRDHVSSAARDLAMCAWLVSHKVELVVNAGYDRILSAPFVAEFNGRIINLHPSLLPAFGGAMNAVEQALQSGREVTGCTVHMVTEAVDAGPILLQSEVPILADDTLATLSARIRVEEHRILPEAIELLAQTSAAFRK